MFKAFFISFKRSFFQVKTNGVFMTYGMEVIRKDLLLLQKIKIKIKDGNGRALYVRYFSVHLVFYINKPHWFNARFFGYDFNIGSGTTKCNG